MPSLAMENLLFSIEMIVDPGLICGYDIIYKIKVNNDAFQHVVGFLSTNMDLMGTLHLLVYHAACQ